ncbi:hypothetical protein [Agromyces bracchium]|uniref:Uncharacterized protein n=1 Tax=Agromyces bracchium TaxID=88376 RepID=A0A6I3MB66_9MICO|nr:hypothetical protein [Agromyces bracchium]MTH70261.1 hypothetical protein [Agromyces bracchium]
MSESEGHRPQGDRSEEDLVADAAVDEVERRARAQEDADADERVAVRDDDGRIIEERAQ